MYFVGISFDVILHRSYFVVDVIYFVVCLPFDVVSYFISHTVDHVFNIFLQRFHNLGTIYANVCSSNYFKIENCKSFKIHDLYRPPSPPVTVCMPGNFFLPVFDSTALVSDTVREFPLR